MDLDQFLSWYFSHNTVLINSIIVAILVMVAATLFFSLRGGSQEAATVSGSLDELEKTMRRILDSAPVRPATEVQSAASLIADDDGPAAVRAPDPQATAQLETLKAETVQKERVIQDLQVKLDTISKNTGLSDADRARIQALEKELKDTKSRLSEYEIIEDDIANLSIYKAENAQLKSEVEKLRRGKSVKKEDPASIPQVSEIVAEFAAIVGAEDNVPDPVTPATAKPEPVIGANTPPVSPTVPVVEAEPLETPTIGGAPVAATATAVTDDEEDGEPLNVDPSKLIAEASSLPEAPDSDDDKDDGEDQGQKLINEFESFIKNG